MDKKHKTDFILMQVRARGTACRSLSKKHRLR